MKKGKFIIIDGIDGSGKGTVVDAYELYFRKKKKKILDLKVYWKRNHILPEPRDLKPYDVIISCEPTFSLVGLAIRDEIVRHNERTYSAAATAQAFALDRFILYKRIIVPALNAGKIVIQERGMTTSMIYQPIQKEPLPLKKILQLEGNQLALKYAPLALIITLLDPKEAIKRLKNRKKKQDFAIFEKVLFLKKAQLRFKAEWFKVMFKRRGTKVIYLETGGTKQQTRNKALAILSDLKI